MTFLWIQIRIFSERDFVLVRIWTKKSDPDPDKRTWIHNTALFTILGSDPVLLQISSAHPYSPFGVLSLCPSRIALYLCIHHNGICPYAPVEQLCIYLFTILGSVLMPQQNSSVSLYLPYWDLSLYVSRIALYLCIHHAGKYPYMSAEQLCISVFTHTGKYPYMSA